MSTAIQTSVDMDPEDHGDVIAHSASAVVPSCVMRSHLLSPRSCERRTARSRGPSGLTTQR
jgi:hypothetical protein